MSAEEPTVADQVATESAKRTAKKTAQKRTAKKTTTRKAAETRVKVVMRKSSRGIQAGQTRTVPKSVAEDLIRQRHADPA